MDFSGHILLCMRGTDYRKKMTFALVMTGKSHGEIAAQMGVSRRTICRWVASEEFKNIFDETFDKTIQSIQGMCLAGISIAIREKLKELINGDKKAGDFFLNIATSGAGSGMNILVPKITEVDQQRVEIRPEDMTIKDVNRYLGSLSNKELQAIVDEWGLGDEQAGKHVPQEI